MAILRLLNSVGGPSLNECAPESFSDLGFKERRDIEAWLLAHPGVIDPEMIVVSSEYDAFDKTSERLDILGAVPIDDTAIRLVVLELKRSRSSKSVELQAIKYAAYVSTLDWEGVVSAYSRHKRVALDEGAGQLRAELDIPEDVEEPLVDNRPKIVLVAPDFRQEVTATVLWLTEEYELDIECVQLTAHRVGDEIVLSTQTLLPLPTAEGFQIRRRQKRSSSADASGDRKRVDWDRLKQVLASIPPGHWMSYQDLAVAAGGSDRAGMAVGRYLSRAEDLPPGCAHRILKRRGTVSSRFAGDVGGPDEARERLKAEGLEFDENGRASKEKRWSPPPDVIT